jgi:creatinine amidohydrolase
MLWHEQSWPQIQQIDKKIPVVIPLGSCEQHGHHLPLFVDSIEVTTVAQRVEAQMRDRILLLPTLWLGHSEHHKDFPGTVSVPASLYSEMIKSVARSVLRAGFTKLFFLNGHGGNETPASQALVELTGEDDIADAAYLAFASWWTLASDSIKADRLGMATPSISHACEYETSMVLAIRPDLVRSEEIIEAPSRAPWNSSDIGKKARFFRRFHRLTAAGNLGKPTAGTAEKGRSLIDAVVADVAKFLEEFATWNELPAVGPK